MGTKQTRKYCSDCEKKVLATKNGPNHILHLILTIITLGLWGVVWILVALFQDPWRCSDCGKRLQI